MIDAPVLEQMARQHGVISRSQLIDDHDWTRARLSRMRAAGILVDAAPGVVAMASTTLGFEGRAMAAQLSAGKVGFLSGWTAGRLFGLRRMPSTTIHFTVPVTFRAQTAEGTALHRSRWYDLDQDSTTRQDGLRIATPMRMLFALAAAFNQFRFQRAAEDAWHRGLITPAEAAEYLERHRCRGKDGVATFERWLDQCATAARPPQSGLEQDLVRALITVGLPRPEVQYPLIVGPGETIHLDVAWPDVKLGVEPGASWWHGGDLGQRRDQDRDRLCNELGWMIVRFDESMRDNLTDSAAQVARIHRRRAADARTVPQLSR